MQNSFDWLKNKLVEFGKLSPGRQLSLISITTLLLFLPVAVWITLQPTRLFLRAGPLITLPGAPSGASAALLIEPEKNLVGPGKEVTLYVNIDAGTHEVTAADVILNYDKNIVSVLEVIPGDFLPVRLGEIFIDNENGKVKFAAGEKPASIKKGGKGTLATLKVKSTGNIGSSQFSFAKPETQVAAVGWETSVLWYVVPGWVHVKEAEIASVLILFKFQGVSTQRPNQNVIYIANSVESEQDSFKGESVAVSDINGVYKTVLASVRPGRYDIFIKGPSQLGRFLGRHTIPTTGEYTINITDKPLLAGDIVPREQRNDRISVADYSLMVTHFGSRMPSTGSPADLDFDGDVDIFDYNMIVSNFGKTGALYGEGSTCPQVITPAKNPTTGECREFSTPCDVPEGWKKVITCVGEGGYLVKPYLVYPADKPMYPEYETAVKNYLGELQNWYMLKVGVTFDMTPVSVVRSKETYLSMRCGLNPSQECINDPKKLEGNWSKYMNEAIHEWVDKWEEKTVALIFSAGGGGFAGANRYANDTGFAITGDWVLEPISGKENGWGIPCKYNNGWECKGGVPKGSPAHELGHAFGLPHPDGYEGKSIMKWHGDYPEVGFLPHEIERLKQSLFMKLKPFTQ